MTNIEYKLLSKLGYAIDLLADHSDDLDELLCAAEEILDDCIIDDINILLNNIEGIISTMANTFDEVKDQNIEEWESLQKAEARIIETMYK